MAQLIALGADHAGYGLKELLKTFLEEQHYAVRDFGTSSTASTDYPDYAHEVAGAVARGEATFGVLVCGTGIGMAITANKVAGVRAANVESIDAATMARLHNNANVLAIGARLTTPERAKQIVTVFLTTAFEGGRHQRRVDKIHSLTNL